MIDFGTIGLKIGDKITFNKGNKLFLVASGKGIPGNGGTLVCYPGRYDGNMFTLHCITHRLMGNEYSKAEDIYELWEYRGETLRSIYNNKRRR